MLRRLSRPPGPFRPSICLSGLQINGLNIIRGAITRGVAQPAGRNRTLATQTAAARNEPSIAQPSRNEKNDRSFESMESEHGASVPSAAETAPAFPSRAQSRRASVARRKNRNSDYSAAGESENLFAGDFPMPLPPSFANARRPRRLPDATRDPLGFLIDRLRNTRSDAAVTRDDAETLWGAYGRIRGTQLYGELSGYAIAQLAEIIRAAADPKHAQLEKGRREIESDVGRREALKAALERVKVIISDAVAAGVSLPGKTGWTLFAAAKTTFTNYAAVKTQLDYCAENSVRVVHSNATMVLRELARSGNYTAYLRAFHDFTQPPYSFKPDAYTWSTMLAAVVYARLDRSEANLGYELGTGFLADLKLPTVFERSMGSQRADTWSTDLAPIALNDDPTRNPDLDALLAQLSAQPTDMYSPSLSPASSTPVLKILATFAKIWSNPFPETDNAARLASFNQTIHALTTLGRPDLAIRFLKLMSNEPYNLDPDRYTYALLLHHCARSVKRNRISPISPNLAATLGSPPSLVSSRTQRKEAVKTAETIWEDMVSRGIKPNVVAFTTMIQLYCANGEPDKALHLLRLMRSVGEPPNGVTYSILVNYLLENGDSSGAMAVFGQMLAAGVEPGVVLYTSLIKYFRDRKDLGGMEKVWKEMEERGVRVNGWTVACLAAEYGTRGEVGRVLDVLERLPKSEWSDAPIWVAVMDALGRAASMKGEVDGKGFFDTAMEMWESRVERRRVKPVAAMDKFPFVGMVGPPVEMAGLSVICDAIGFNGTPEMLDKVWAEAGQERDGRGKSWEAMVDNANAAYVEALCRLGRHEDARTFVMTLERGGERPVGVRVASTLLTAWTHRSTRSDVLVDERQLPKVSLEQLRDDLSRRFGNDFVAEVDRLLTELRLVGTKDAIDRIRPTASFTMTDATEALKSTRSEREWLAKTDIGTAPRLEPLEVPAEPEVDELDVRRPTKQSRPRVDTRAKRREVEDVLARVEAELQGGKPADAAVDVKVTEEDLKRLRGKRAGVVDADA